MRSSPSQLDCEIAVEFLDFVTAQRSARRPVEHRAARDVEPRAVALAHDRAPGEQSAGQRARVTAARAEIVEAVQAAVDPGEGDAEFSIAEVVRNDDAVSDRREGLEGAKIGHRSAPLALIRAVSTGSRG